MKITDSNYTENTVRNTPEAVEQRKVTSLKAHIDKKGKTSGERVDFSEKANDIRKINEVIQKTPDVREDKISVLKEKITSGTYHVSSRKIADKMLKEFIKEEL